MINTNETANIIVNILAFGFSIFMIIIFILIWVNTNKIVDNTKKHKDEFSNTIEDNDDYECIKKNNHCCINSGPWIKATCNDIYGFCEYNDKKHICEELYCPTFPSEDKCNEQFYCNWEKKKSYLGTYDIGDNVTTMEDENGCNNGYVKVPHSIGNNSYFQTYWSKENDVNPVCLVSNNCYNPQLD